MVARVFAILSALTAVEQGVAPAHDAFADLTGSYALGALSTSEREAFELHLTACATCANDVRELAETADAIAGLLSEIDLPPGLRARLLESLRTRQSVARPGP